MTLEGIISSLMPLHPKKIILFGSRASGVQDGGSDYDIAVIAETDSPFHERFIQARRLLRTTDAFDLFVFTEEEINRAKDHNPFVAEIITKGIVVYEV
jgi:predicted nucleotidyltransferase